MSPLAFLFAVLLTTATAASCPTAVTFAIGSYTGQSWLPSSAGAGVTLARLTKGMLNTTAVLPVATSGRNPSYVAATASSLYLANENGPGSVTRVLFSEKAPYIKSTHVRAKSDGTTHVSYMDGRKASPILRHIFAANYNGAVSSFIKTPSNMLSLAAVWKVPERYASRVRNPDAGLSDRFDAPHPHQCMPFKRGIVVPDLGSDIVWYLHVSKRTGALTRISATLMTPGDGPRHAAVHAPSSTVYVVNELSVSISMLQLGCGDKSPGQLGLCSTRPLLDPSTDKQGAAAAAIRVSGDGKFVYASVRYPGEIQGKIVGFKLNAKSGNIVEKVGEFSSEGVHPRDFYVVDKVFDGYQCRSFVAVVNRDTDDLVLIERDMNTGTLGDVRHRMAVTTPTSVIMLNK